MKELNEMIKQLHSEAYSKKKEFIPEGFEKTCGCKWTPVEVPDCVLGTETQFLTKTDVFEKKKIVKKSYESVERYYCPKCGSELKKEGETFET